MLLVIFGAGASFDSSPDDVPRLLPTSPPPLAKDLLDRRFDSIASEYRQSRPVIDLLRRRMHADSATSLETELAAFAENSGASPERRQQLMAFRMYLYRVISTTVDEWLHYTQGFTHYLTLFNYLLDWHLASKTPILFATFNYDVMIERAAETVFTDWKFTSDLDGYVNRERYKLVKLHGSTSWSRVVYGHPTVVSHSSVDVALSMAADGLNLEAAQIVGRPPGIQSGQIVSKDLELWLPAMAIPLANKTHFECPPDHLARFRKALPHVKHVLIVGWRRAEPHAVELLAGSDPKEGLFPGYSLGVVDWADEGIAQVKANLGIAAERGRLLLEEPGGFSGLIGRLDDLGPFLGSGY